MYFSKKIFSTLYIIPKTNFHSKFIYLFLHNIYSKYRYYCRWLFINLIVFKLSYTLCNFHDLLDGWSMNVCSEREFYRERNGFDDKWYVDGR